ncbi:MAG: RDD family protein [Caulobacteraceae bacterium]
MQDDEWYLVIGRRRVGPVTEADLVARLRSGEINGQTLIWTEGQDGWLPLATRLPALLGSAAAISNEAPLPGAAPQPPPVQPTTANLGWAEAPRAPAGAEWTDTAPHPWRRYFARMVDNLLFSIVAAPILAMFVTPPDATQIAQGGSAVLLREMLISLGLQLVMLPVSALFVGVIGYSPGKWLFGVRVLTGGGGRLGVTQALVREFRVFVLGTGLGVFPINLFALLTAHGRLLKRKITIWDERGHFVVVYRPANAQLGYSIFGAILLLGAVGLFVSAIAASVAAGTLGTAP